MATEDETLPMAKPPERASILIVSDFV